MSRAYSPEQERISRAEAARLAKVQAEQFALAFKNVLGTPDARAVLFQFLTDVGADNSAFSTNGMAQSHAIGLQDAARWWITNIREHCPQWEQRMRNEANQAAKALQIIEDSSHDE